MAISWTKNWSGSDNGSIITGVDLKNIQDDLANVVQTEDISTIISLLSKTTAVDMHATTFTSLYTSPVGKTSYVSEIVVVNPSDSLAGGTSFAFGSGTAGSDWISGVSLASVSTASTGYTTIRPANGALLVEIAAGSSFGMKATTAATADPCTATIMLFGFTL